MFDDLGRARAVLTAHLDAVLDARVPSIVLAPSDDDDRLGGTRLGGAPDLPPGLAWPRPPQRRAAGGGAPPAADGPPRHRRDGRHRGALAGGRHGGRAARPRLRRRRARAGARRPQRADRLRLGGEGESCVVQGWHSNHEGSTSSWTTDLPAAALSRAAHSARFEPVPNRERVWSKAVDVEGRELRIYALQTQPWPRRDQARTGGDALPPRPPGR